jgi:hypothetical protein
MTSLCIPGSPTESPKAPPRRTSASDVTQHSSALSVSGLQQPEKKTAEADEPQSPGAKKKQLLKQALHLLSEHPFLYGINAVTLLAIAKVAVKKTEDVIVIDAMRAARQGADSPHTVASRRPSAIDAGDSLRRQTSGKSVAMFSGTIMEEGESGWASDSLWIIEKGAVEIFENGDRLGELHAGDFFGGAVAFGHTQTQPFTVKLLSDHVLPDDKLVCWCIPIAAMQNVLLQFPEAKLLLTTRIADQVKRLFTKRMTELLFFQHCSKEFIQDLQQHIEVSYELADTQIIDGGEPADTMLMVMSGCVLKENPREKAQEALDAPPDAERRLTRKSLIASTGLPACPTSWASRFKEKEEEENLRGHAPSWGARFRRASSALNPSDLNPNSWANRVKKEDDPPKKGNQRNSALASTRKRSSTTPLPEPAQPAVSSASSFLRRASLEIVRQVSSDSHLLEKMK